MDNQFNEPIAQGSQNIWTIISTILITAIIIGGGVWWWQKSAFEKEKETLQQQIEELKSQISGTIDTSDWKTYQNEEYGYEIKYPQNWFINVSDAEREVYCGGPDNKDCYGGTMTISNYKNPEQYHQESLDQEVPAKPDDFVELGLFITLTDSSLEEFADCNDGPGSEIINKEITTINNSKAIDCSKITTDHPVGLFVRSVTLKNNNKVYGLSYIKNDIDNQLEQIISQIISTFKFIKQETIIQESTQQQD